MPLHEKPAPNTARVQPHYPQHVRAIRDKSGRFESLELRVRIEGQLHTILLLPDVLEAAGLSGPAVAEELREIRRILSRIEGATPLSAEIANDLFAMIDANYRLPKRETG